MNQPLAARYAAIARQLTQAAEAFAQGARLFEADRPPEDAIRRGLDLLGEAVEDMPRSEHADRYAETAH